MKKFVLLALLCFVNFFYAQAQEKYTISGYIKEKETGETLIGAYVVAYPKGKEDMQRPPYALANEYGFYSLTLPAGEYSVSASYLQSRTQPQQINLTGNLRLNLEISTGFTTEEVVVTGEKKDANVTKTEMGTVELKPSELKPIPVAFGEQDILKTIQLLPGVASAGEGNSGFYVRGGGPDQNLILLDEAVVYNTGHLFGFFSVFNSDAIKNTTLIKGGMPPQYGGRLSSVLDISMKEGNYKEFHGEGGIGIISSRLTLEGPLVKDKSSFMVSGRRTYIDILVKPFLVGRPAEGSGYYFYDANAKVNYRFSDKDRLYLSGYFGRDVFSFSSDDDFGLSVPWGNATATLRWNHLFNDKLFVNTSAIYNDYNFSVEAGGDEFSFKLFSGIRDLNLKSDFSYFPEKHNIKFGLNYTYHTFTPSSISGRAGETIIEPQANKKYAHETAVYIQDELDVTDRVRLQGGLRGVWFQQMGPYTYYTFDDNHIPLDSTHYEKGEPVTSYFGLEPRINGRYLINEKSSLKASYTYNNQFLHLVSNSGSTLPTDLWIPSTRMVRPQRGSQYAAGYFRNFKENKYEASVELYYKKLHNQIEYRQYYIPTFSNEPETDFVFGEGESYGAEFFLKKSTGQLNGWIGYTLSKTTRTFPDLNNGKPFYAKFDRRHDLSVVAVYELNKRVTFGSTFVFGSGNAITIPERIYFIDQNVLFDYSEINTYRLPPYHRLDLSVTLNGKETEGKKFKSSWNFSIYNVYNRHNPYIIYFDEEGDLLEGDLTISAKKVYIFPILPSITWNFKF